MDKYTDERDKKLLAKDPYTFSVLSRIIGGECKLLLTDHEKLIICFTTDPFPVWIWTPDDAADEEKERAYSICKENGLVDGKHRFNLKYELAEYFIRRAADEGLKLSVEVNMFAYNCPDPIRPTSAVSGEKTLCRSEDLEELTQIVGLFHDEIGVDLQDEEAYRENARAHIEGGRTYFWTDEKGKHAATCKWEPVGELATINLVYTRKECRRLHFAEHLVYEVTELAKKEGYLPTLYTNADYVASNACYEKIGYILQGKLCTIG